MADSNSKKVIIIGAGVTGLSLAQGLKKAGIPVAVYEKNESRHTRRNWTFAIHGGIDALEDLLPEKVFTSLPSTQVDPYHPGLDSWYEFPLYNGATGELIRNLNSKKIYRLARDKLRALLLTDLEDCVHWSKDLTGLTYLNDGTSVTASFADGSSGTGAIVVGCDGTHSAVRSLLVGPENTQLTRVGNIAADMCFSQHTREHALWLRSAPHHPLYSAALHPSGLMGFVCVHDASDKDHPENWTFFTYISYPCTQGQDEWSKEQLIDQSKSLAQNFCEPWKSVYEWMDPNEANVWHTKMMHWDPSLPDHDWDNRDGRVTLAGDATHPMSFQRGQGANTALRDSLLLFRGLKRWFEGETERKNVVVEFETEMKDRGGREVRMSAESTLTLHDPAKAMKGPLVSRGVQPSEKE